MIKVIPVILLAYFIPLLAVSQEKDTVVVADSAKIVIPEKNITTGDTTKVVHKRKFIPRQAAIRSAILPGLGQIYNKKYWKVPIVYTAIGIPVALFFDNKNWYNKTRYALSVVANNVTLPDSLAKVDPQLRPLVDLKATGSLIRYRNEFRKNMDYSVLFTLLFWGLNVVDATVDAHLKGFNVSNDLSLSIQPAILPGNAAGLSLVFTFEKNRSKAISSLNRLRE